MSLVLKPKAILRLILHLLIVGFFFGPIMFVIEKLLGYHSVFPNSIFYYWLWYLFAFIFIALVMALIYHLIIHILKIDHSLAYKILVAMVMCFLLSFVMYRFEGYNNMIRQLLIVGLSFSALGILYVLLESKTSFLAGKNEERVAKRE